MIDDAVDLYFNTKRITENDVLKNGTPGLTQTPLRMLESTVLEYHTSQNNTYLYSCTNPSIAQMEIEFIKFRTWIGDLENTKCKQELSQMLFPIFCHLYLDTLYENNGQQVQSALIFFKRNQSFFTCESLRDIMKDIGNTYKKEDIENKPLVKAFRSAKCKMKLSSLSATLLKNYISNCDEATILLNVLNSWFVIEDEDTNMREEDDPAVCPESEMIMGQRIENCSSPGKSVYEDNDHASSDSDEDRREDRNGTGDGVTSWATTFKNLRNSSPQPSPLLLLQMHKSQNISCSSVCYQSRLVAVGSLHSDVKVFSFSEDRSLLPKSRSLPIKLNIPNFNEDLDNGDGCSGKDFSILRGHCGSVSAVRLLCNPDVILSTSEDTTLRAWRRNDFSCAAVYRGHNNPIWGLDVSALNLYIATGSQDKTARLWNLDKTYPLRLYVGHHSSVTCVKFHPNGVYLASGSTDKTVRLFSVIDGKSARLFTGHTGPIHCLSFSPDGQYLASAGDGHEVIIWNLALGQQFLSVDTESQFVCDLSWNLDSSVLAITFLQRHICLLHVQKKSKEKEHEIIGRYELPDNRFVSCQFVERNNLISVSVV